MNLKKAKELRRHCPGWRQHAYIQLKNQGIPNLELPKPPDGCHWKGETLVVNTIRLHPECGRASYRAAKRMTVVNLARG